MEGGRPKIQSDILGADCCQEGNDKQFVNAQNDIQKEEANAMAEIVTLETREGKNPGEAVASYERSIVFLSAGPKPGQRVRVTLEEITTKKDSRGRTMYRGKPAPVEYTERWKDLGNDVIGQVAIATDWLFNESEEGVRDERPIATRDGRPTIKSSFKMVWGANAASSVLGEHQVKVTPLEREKVTYKGELEWEKTGEREEILPVVTHQVTKLAVLDRGDWYYHRFDPMYEAAWKAVLSVSYVTTYETAQTIEVTWGDLPAWYQTELGALYPLCSCGRKRRDAQVWDGYPKCETCRHEETCGRCGKVCSGWGTFSEGTWPWWTGGRMVCGDCFRYEKAEQLIAQKLPVERREELAEMAKSLLAVDPLSREAGEVILGSTMDHIASEWDRKRLVREWKGYAFYYFTDQGVFGSKFSPAALTVLQFLPQAVGNQLVELVAWLAGRQKVEDCERYSDFYHLSQVMGRSDLTPPSAESDLSKFTLAVRLRGSEADRIAALTGYQALVEKLGADSDQVKTVANILQGNEQDYAAALNAIREIQELFVAQGRGEVLADFGGHFRRMGENSQSDIWVIGPDGEEAEPTETNYRKRYTSEGDRRWELIGPEMLALRWSRGQGGRQFEESWEVVKLPVSGLTEAQTTKARELEPHERFRGDGTGFDLTRAGMVTFSVSRDERENPVRSFRSASGAEESVPWPCEVYGWSFEANPEEGYHWTRSSSKVRPTPKRHRPVFTAGEDDVSAMELAMKKAIREARERDE